MGLADVLERSVDDAKRIKEYVCRKGPHNIHRLVTWYRGDESIALAVMLESDRDQLLEVTGMGIFGFGADAVAIVSDAWMPASPGATDRRHSDELRDLSDDELASMNLHPITGKPLEYGDLNKLADQGGLAKGWVVEALMTQATSRAGYQRGCISEFRYADRNLLWGQERRMIDEGKGSETDVMRGEISDQLVKQMNAPTLQQTQGLKGLDLTTQQRDVLTAGMMHGRGLPVRVVLLPEGADHLRVLRQNNLLSGW